MEIATIGENRIVIREYEEGRDIEVVGKLEKSCEIGCNNKEVSIFTNMMADPKCRIRFFPVHVLLVAELRQNGKLVGVVRGCIKSCVGTRFGCNNDVRLGCILGLRVSPTHRRMGIGLKLVKAVEEWLIGHGAHYTFLATEKNNVASTNLFTSKFNYINFSSLVIFAQPAISSQQSYHIKIEKLQIDQAISLYNNKFRSAKKDMYPTDMDAILNEKLSLGAWVSYFKEEEWVILQKNLDHEVISSKRPSSWVMFSIWNSCEAYKLHIRKYSINPLRFFHATLSNAKDKIVNCLKSPMCNSLQKPFGFLFLYGIYGEGDRLQELLKSIWSFASRLAENVSDCKVIITELGVNDPLIEHVPQESMSCIDDLWYLKKVDRIIAGEKEETPPEAIIGEVGNVFVDPRDF